jgi:hypothetical protein
MRKRIKTDDLAVLMDKALEVGKDYVIFSETGNTFEGIYRGLELDTLHFTTLEEDNIYIKPENVVMIEEGR